MSSDPNPDEFLTPDEHRNLARYSSEFDQLFGLLVRRATDAWMADRGLILVGDGYVQ